jgi:hypothetical protein
LEVKEIPMSKLIDEKDFSKLIVKMPDELSIWELTEAFLFIQTTEIEMLSEENLTKIHPKHRKRR